MRKLVQQDTINIKGTLIDVSSPKVMGILNVTADSFYDGGAYLNLNDASQQVANMLQEGADIIDVGGASSRPGAKPIDSQTEQQRVLPVIEMIRSDFPHAVISIDTNQSTTAAMAVEAGAHIVNDISAGDDDVHMIPVVGELKVPFIAMHKQGTPETMQQHPTYHDVVVEVIDYLKKKVDTCYTHGILDLVLDPGFGFGKTVTHNYQLLKQLNSIKQLTGCPLLVGVSRKSMINKVLSIKPEDALNGTSILHAWALANGANILRVHDVKEAKQAITLFEAYRKA